MDVRSVQNLPKLRHESEIKLDNREEAAAEFERILVKQFVDTMTANLFQDALSGETGPSWMSAYGDIQRDALSDALTEHLVKSDSMRLRDLLLRQWNLEAQDPDSLQSDCDT